MKLAPVLAKLLSMKLKTQLIILMVLMTAGFELAGFLGDKFLSKVLLGVEVAATAESMMELTDELKKSMSVFSINHTPQYQPIAKLKVA